MFSRADAGSQHGEARPDGVLQQNVQAIAGLEAEAKRRRTLSHRAGDRIAKFAGTMPFVLLHGLWFTVWIAVNAGGWERVRPFDPYPFTFLTFCVSLEAIILSSFVLMSQNRMSREADDRAQLDLQINLLTEQESTAALQLLERICAHLGVATGADPDAAALVAKTDAAAVARMVQKSAD